MIKPKQRSIDAAKLISKHRAQVVEQMIQDDPDRARCILTHGYKVDWHEWMVRRGSSGLPLTMQMPIYHPLNMVALDSEIHQAGVTKEITRRIAHEMIWTVGIPFEEFDKWLKDLRDVHGLKTSPESFEMFLHQAGASDTFIETLKRKPIPMPSQDIKEIWGRTVKQRR